MGFHVRLKEDDERLLRFLKTSPSDVFGRPYAGYLFFLIGGADTVALEWLRKHLVALDSLTGEFVAFALFADKVPVQLDVAFGGVERHEAFLGDVPFTDVERIDTYVKHGKLGFVANGDHLNAVTYATDRVARAFGVLDRLPCLVVLDAFPSDDVDVIDLRDDEMTKLLEMLRIAVHRLYTEPQFPEFSAALKELGGIRLDLDRINHAIGRKKHEISEMPTRHAIESTVSRLYRGIHDHLLAGSHRGFNVSIGQLINYLKPSQLRINPAFEEGVSRRIVRVGKTIAALRDFETKSWPLDEHERSKYLEIVTKYVVPLLSAQPMVSTLPTREEFVDLQSALTHLQSGLMAGVFASFGTEAHATDALMSAYSEKQRVAQDEIRQLTVELDTVRERGREAVHQCVGKAAPSLRRILREIGRERKIRVAGRAVTDKLAAYAGKVTDPETILKVLGFALGAG
jgi:hypothetical protein